MCHLAVEKALKGLFWQVLNIIPPKTHDLNYLIRKIGIQPGEELHNFLVQLTEAHTVTRYPEEIKNFKKSFLKQPSRKLSRKAERLLNGQRNSL